MKEKKIIEVAFHGRGGQTAITASQLLAEMAYESGFKDAIAIPIIGAERRGAPIQAFSKISRMLKLDHIVVYQTQILC